MITVDESGIKVERYSDSPRPASCFFEWVYFSNVASVIDDKGVYESRAAAGEKLAENEDVPIDDNSITVPVPDTAKAAADAFAYKLRIPCVEGIFRNRYIGRTFIRSAGLRESAAEYKYIPLPSVLSGKRVFLLEDSIVRSTTLKVLVRQIRQKANPLEIHVRVACPPIIAPCFYGIDMSTVSELFAAGKIKSGRTAELKPAVLESMARDLEIDSLRYLSVEEVSSAIDLPENSMCLGCVTGIYPTPWGQKLFDKSVEMHLSDRKNSRVF